MNAIIALKCAMKYADSLSYGEIIPSQNYNDLENIPITYLEGNLSTPIVLSKLSSGIYRISGNYFICNENDTCYVDASGQTLFFITRETNTILKINSNAISFYNISDDTYIETSVPTINEISLMIENLKKLIPTKTSQLQNDSGFITSKELQEHMNENFSKITNSEIQNLF